MAASSPRRAGRPRTTNRGSGRQYVVRVSPEEEQALQAAIHPHETVAEMLRTAGLDEARRRRD